MLRVNTNSLFYRSLVVGISFDDNPFVHIHFSCDANRVCSKKKKISTNPARTSVVDIFVGLICYPVVCYLILEI
jgi:hypothetical protein